MSNRSNGAFRVAFALIVLLAAGLLGLRIWHYLPFIADDTFISLRYAQRLLEGKGITWSEGQRVEGYTNLLWVLLCALLGGMNVDLVVAARLLGVGATLAALAALVTHIRARFPSEKRFAASICALIPFALSAPIAVWAIGGLEQPLLLALLGWAVFFCLRYLRKQSRLDLLWSGVFLGLVAMTRADGVVFVALIFSFLVAANLLRKQRILWAFWLLPIPALLITAQVVFRKIYYSEWLPNTAYVKVSFTVDRLLSGMRYLIAVSLAELPLLVLAAIGVALLFIRRDRIIACMFLVVALGYSLYLVLIGGDIFPAARLFLPVILIACFAAAEASALAFTGNALRPAPLGLLGLCAVATFYSHVQARRAESERWEADGRVVGLFLRSAFGDKHPLLVADAAGAIPFFSQLDAVDPLGLCDRHISHSTSPLKGHGFQGHELADGKYVLDHKPDLIIFGLPTGSSAPLLTSDEQISNDPRFTAHYQLVCFHLAGPPPVESNIYVRRIDGPLGVQISANQIVIPAYLADSSDTTYVIESPGGQPSLDLAPYGTTQVSNLAIPRGRWTISADAPGLTYSSGAASFTVKNMSATHVRIANFYVNREGP